MTTNNMPEVIRIGIIVGEASGDLLGAALIEQCRKIYPDLTFEGVFGPRLKALGGKALYDSERLAVMGFVEPLKRLPELLSMRRSLIKHYCDNPPDVFIGIDAPDFNLGIERKLKQHGIKTVHYVSPSVWAWRQGRIKKIKQAVDLMLVLFPFEEDFYRQHQVPVAYVGHPMAKSIVNELRGKITTEAAPFLKGADSRSEAGDFVKLIDENPPQPPFTKGGEEKRQPPLQKGGDHVADGGILAILPGSRHSEIAHLAEPFLKTALLLKAQFPNIQFISPMASPAIREHFLRIKAQIAPALEIKLLDGQADEALMASDCALITSGTATLQAMLHQCPMVVGFKTSAFNAWLIRKLYKHSFFALPNILCGKRVVDEYFQEEVTPERLLASLKVLLEDSHMTQAIRREFSTMSRRLNEPAAGVGAEAIQNLLSKTHANCHN